MTDNLSANQQANAESKDFVTVLTCNSANAKAQKRFKVLGSKKIEKTPYFAGLEFKHKTIAISNLRDIFVLLEQLQETPSSFIIRGGIKEGAPSVIKRRMKGEGAFIEPHPRRWVMVDCDKLPIPEYMDAASNPDEVAMWVREHLPKAFRNAECVYQFSSSQNIPKKLGKKASKHASLHLIFWLEKAATDQELRNYFKRHSDIVDAALFNAVQPHFTATPQFAGMDDPLPKRLGMLKGDSTVRLPLDEMHNFIPNAHRGVMQGDVNDEDRNAAIELLSDCYPKEGNRDRFCGAVAGFIYRGGCDAEYTAEFVRDLALYNKDDEADKRYSTAHRICLAVDNNEPAMGGTTLKQEFDFMLLDELGAFLKIGKPDIDTVINKLSNQSSAEEILDVLRLLVGLAEYEKELLLECIKEQTRRNKGTLTKMLKGLSNEQRQASSEDNAAKVMRYVLQKQYAGGKHLIRSQNRFWHYNGKHWEESDSDMLKQQLIQAAPVILDNDASLSSVVNNALNLLEGEVYVKEDILRFNSQPAPVINCKNGEYWLDGEHKGFRPHQADSYLRYCLDVDYNPTQDCPQFKKAVLEIFSKSSNPEEMYRHITELFGYIIQPWRKIAAIVILYGSGRNGKSSLMELVQKLMGKDSVMQERMGEIEKSTFKVGALAGKLMLIDDDMDSGTCLPDGFLKKISTEKVMTGEKKYQDPFSFTCRAVPFMLANDFPSAKDVSYGLKRRIMIVPFAKQFSNTEVDLELFDRIWTEEASGILNECIAGFERLKERGEFSEPEDCIATKKQWERLSNPLEGFLNDMCEKGRPDQWEYVSHLYKCYANYCEQRGIKHTLTQASLIKKLTSADYKSCKRKGYDVVKGIICNGDGDLLKQSDHQYEEFMKWKNLSDKEAAMLPLQRFLRRVAQNQNFSMN